MAAPTRCIPGYPDTGPQFLDASFATPTRHGYSFRFVAGPAAAAEAAPGARVSPSSMRGFAYIAEPMTRGQTGVRAFCGEASGVICFSLDGRIQDEGDGTCPSSCTPFD
jgi:hypothetical protein